MEEPSIGDDTTDQESQFPSIEKWLKRKEWDEAPPTSLKKPRMELFIDKTAEMAREAVLSPGIKAVRAADQEDGCCYLRVGERLDDFASGAEQAIDKHSIVVAIVDPAFDQVGGKPQMITYMAIDTYKINGIEVGDYASADQDLILANIDFCPDEYWRTALAEMATSRGVAANLRDLDYAVVEYSNHTPQGERSRTDLRPKKTTLRPRHSLSSWANITKLKNHRKGDISAVITFVKYVANVEMRLPRNLQAGLDYDKNFGSLKKYFLS